LVDDARSRVKEGPRKRGSDRRREEVRIQEGGGKKRNRGKISFQQGGGATEKMAGRGKASSAIKKKELKKRK